MLILSVIFFIISAFAGYILGRFGDYYLNFWLKDPSWAPHHWIYGLTLMAIGLFFFKNSLELYIIFFGLGLFISDSQDFLDLKFIGSDKKDKNQRKFWHIN